LSATELLLFSLELLATDDEDFAELDDATELLLFSLELLATDDEDFAELEDATELLLRSSIRAEDDEEELTTDDEDFAELDDATELLDPSTSLGMTLEEGGSSTLEDDSTELEETAELELLAIEEELFSLEELTTDEEDSTELEEVTELLDPSLSLRMTLEEDSSAGFSSPDGPLEELSSPQAARPKASANAQVPRARKFFFMRDL